MLPACKSPIVHVDWQASVGWLHTDENAEKERDNIFRSLEKSGVEQWLNIWLSGAMPLILDVTVSDVALNGKICLSIPCH